MKIDQTRLDSFWRNPDKYRLTYECNLVPRTISYGLARGSALHIIAEERAAGRPMDEVEQVLRGEVRGQRGTLDYRLDGKAISVARAMWDEFERQYPADCGIELLASELEFEYPIPGSPHSMVGRIDQLLRRGDRNGELWCGEIKTASGKSRFEYVEQDWIQKAKKQADFEIIGARTLGHDVQGVFVRTIVESVPVKVWPLDVRRTEHQLLVTQLNVHQTCEIIEMLRATFGSNMPWPHLASEWPCNKAATCEYESVCMQMMERLDESALAGYRKREEHLTILRPPNVAAA